MKLEIIYKDFEGESPREWGKVIFRGESLSGDPSGWKEKENGGYSYFRVSPPPGEGTLHIRWYPRGTIEFRPGTLFLALEGTRREVEGLFEQALEVLHRTFGPVEVERKI